MVAFHPITIPNRDNGSAILRVMPLTQKHIDELKQIYKEEQGRELSDKEAWKAGVQLVTLFRLLLKADSERLTKQNPE